MQNNLLLDSELRQPRARNHFCCGHTRTRTIQFQHRRHHVFEYKVHVAWMLAVVLVAMLPSLLFVLDFGSQFIMPVPSLDRTGLCVNCPIPVKRTEGGIIRPCMVSSSSSSCNSQELAPDKTGRVAKKRHYTV